MNSVATDENFLADRIRAHIFQNRSLDDARMIIESLLRETYTEVNSEVEYSSVLSMNVYCDEHEVVFDTYNGKLFILINGREHHDLSPINCVEDLVLEIVNRINLT